MPALREIRRRGWWVAIGAGAERDESLELPRPQAVHVVDRSDFDVGPSETESSEVLRDLGFEAQRVKWPHGADSDCGPTRRLPNLILDDVAVADEW